MRGGRAAAAPTGAKGGMSCAGFFYPESCHGARITRRQLLTGSAALLGVAAIGKPSAGRAADDGTAIVRQYATTPEDAWVVCHGLRAMGREFSIKGGRNAADFLLETHLAQLPANGKTALGFPPEVEVHPNMFLKTMLEAGVSLDHTFMHQGRRRSLRDVLDGARALFRPSQLGGSPNMLPWSIIAFSHTTSPVKSRWTNAWGETVDLDPVVEGALVMLEEASLPLTQLMREGKPEIEKAPVHGFTCAGTHMIYSILTAVHAGFTGRDRRERTQRQVDLLVWRLTADLGLIERFYRERAAERGVYWFDLDSRVKILGHAEECLAFGTRQRVVKLTPEQKSQWTAARMKLRRMLGDMEDRDMKEAREVNVELFRQLVGDACHARHGLTLT
jgi:hypothetical protein